MEKALKRSKHNLSHYRLATMMMGKLYPIACMEVLPGDTFQHSTAALIRVSPLVAPVMHPVSVRIHHWFIPTRLLWDGWEDFITGGQDGEGGSAGTYPTLTAGGGGFSAGGLLDYLGVPPGIASLEVCELPVRAFNMVFNEFYRDQDLVTERAEDDVTIPNIAWEKDYITSARPWPQRGPEVTLPLGDKAPVMGLGKSTQSYLTGPVNVYETGGSATTQYAKYRYIDSGATDTQVAIEEDPDNAGFPGIFADLASATAANVNDIRRAFALQRYAEARARYGARYTEYLRYLGVSPSDARLQRPEYLGGGKQTIAFSEVLQTGPDSGDDGVGNLKGHGIAAVRTNRYRRFFEEHGYVISVMSVRPKTIYAQALHRMWSRSTKEDYFQKELEAIGQQEVYRREVYAQSGANGATVLGYQNRYDEYRHHPSTIHGQFRTTPLYDWHFARIFGSAPALNASLINCDPGMRPFADQVNDTLLCMISNQVQARRMVNRSGASRIL